MKTLFKECATILFFVFIIAFFRTYLVDFILSFQLGNPIEQIRIMPGLVIRLLTLTFLVLSLYGVSRWWVWEKPLTKYIVVYLLFVFPLIYFFILMLSGILLVLSLLTVTKTTFLQDIVKVVFSIIWLFLISTWLPFLLARCSQGKNPWYSMYDAVKDMFTLHGLRVSSIYLIPIILLFSTFLFGWNSLGTLPFFWLSYLFARQYVVSKKKTLKQYVLYVWHSYTKTCKKAYKKVF